MSEVYLCSVHDVSEFRQLPTHTSSGYVGRHNDRIVMHFVVNDNQSLEEGSRAKSRNVVYVKCKLYQIMRNSQYNINSGTLLLLSP